ncbi:MAG: endonuclease/exonuclease/phosphatase family protein [Agitococcus sp.]|nr:endonuclease/exonuclease/phosphatase family protein [Agitococcus sp.]
MVSAIPAAPAPLKAGVKVKLSSVNVLSTNTNYAAFTHWLEVSAPDVIVVLEVSLAWERTLQKQTQYPYQKIMAREDNFGIALLSKYPLTLIPDNAIPTALSDPPSISAVVSVPMAAPFQVTAIHPSPPLSPTLSALHAAQLNYFGDRTASFPGASFLLGDFNATPWSSASLMLGYRGLTRISGMRPTWPAKGLPFELIPLDVIMSNKNAKPMSFSLGPNIGSDHRPIEASVLVPFSP